MPLPIHGRLAAVDTAVAGFSDGKTSLNPALLLYAVPAGRRATVTLNLCNRSAGSVNALSIAIATSGISITDAQCIEFGPPIAATGVLERTGITLAAGQGLYATKASPTGSFGPNVSAVVWGIEEDAL